ncbi:MAG: TIGR01777 family protein [Acidobacteria bacterium]|nr:TIGR01777 family protein [Acidobacteriota bacterium]
MLIAVTGAGGFLGQRLLQRLSSEGHDVHIVGRRRPSTIPPTVRFSAWDALQDEFPTSALEHSDAIVHLAGEPIARRWTRDAKQRIRASRAGGTNALIRALAKLPRKPHTLIAASAIGFYGDRGEEVLTETSRAGSGFLPEVCSEWEHAAAKAADYSIRPVHLRIGIVLGPEGGALKKMLPPFRLGLGGPAASGRQWMSWIHAEDVAGLVLFALGNAALQGPVNAAAPNPVRNADFARALGAALRRPAFLPVPSLALKLMFGEMAELVLASQRVRPEAALAAGYRFRFEDVNAALTDLLRGTEAKVGR